MLRPATPLAVLLFAAFALLVLATISTPIIKQIPLSSFNIENFGDLSFGVFGYCTSAGCSPIEIGYDTCKLFPRQCLAPCRTSMFWAKY